MVCAHRHESSPGCGIERIDRVLNRDPGRAGDGSNCCDCCEGECEANGAALRLVHFSSLNVGAQGSRTHTMPDTTQGLELYRELFRVMFPLKDFAISCAPPSAC